MPILVSDTSVLIDLERGLLIEVAFSLPFELVVPDILYERELKGFGGELLISLGLRVEELDGEGVSKAMELRQQQPSISFPDSLALTLSIINNWTLITGDKILRALAKEHQVECHGVLWIVDQILEHDPVSAKQLRDGLESIAKHPRCRLPHREIDKRIERCDEIIQKAINEIS